MNDTIGGSMKSAENNQVAILVMVLENLDFKQFTVRALRVLDENPGNKLALMVYQARFEPADVSDGRLLCVRFNEQAVEEFLDRYAGELDLKTLLALTKLVVLKEAGEVDSDARLYKSLLKRAHISCRKDAQSLISFYDCLITWLGNSYSTEWASTRNLENPELAYRANNILDARKQMANMAIEQLKMTTDLSMEKRKLLIVQIMTSPLFPEQESENQYKDKDKGKVLGIVGAVILGAALLFIFLSLL